MSPQESGHSSAKRVLDVVPLGMRERIGSDEIVSRAGARRIMCQNEQTSV